MAHAPTVPSILVTGASGLLGTAVVRQLAAGSARLRLLSRHAWRPPCDPSRAEVVTGDVSDPATMAAAVNEMEAVVHLAAETRAAEAGPLHAWQSNVAPLAHALEATRHRDFAPTVLLAGSESQAGLPEHLPLDERAPDAPVTAYDLSKLQAEQLLELYVRRGLAHGTCLRLPTLYGPGPPNRSPGRGMVRATVQRALAGRDLTIYGTGTWRRDYLHVTDAAAAFVAAFDHPDDVDGRHFLVGTGESIRVCDAIDMIADEVAHQTGRERVKVQRWPVPPGWSAVDERDVTVDATAFRRATGWSPAVTFRSGLTDLVAELRSAGSTAC